MKKRPNRTKTRSKFFRIDEKLAQAIDHELTNPSNDLPYGSWTRLIESLLANWLKQRRKKRLTQDY